MRRLIDVLLRATGPYSRPHSMVYTTVAIFRRSAVFSRLNESTPQWPTLPPAGEAFREIGFVGGDLTTGKSDDRH